MGGPEGPLRATRQSYEAFRAYNSGSVDKEDLNNAKGATADYVLNTANRLMGHQWNGM